MSQPAASLRPSMAMVDQQLDQLLELEHAAINARRKLSARAAVQNPVPGRGGPDVYDTSALALSGGGIRSASFSLGAMQALEQHFGIRRIDYLSTVSGGGYIGSALTAAMATTQTGHFPYGILNDVNDPPALRHLRNFSNYLLPRGEPMALPRSISVVLRGLVANVIMAGAAVTLLALFTVLAFPRSSQLMHGSLLLALVWHAPTWPFALSLGLLAALSLYLLGWAVWRARPSPPGMDVRGAGVDLPAWALLILLGVAFLDLQPVLLAGLFWLRHRGGLRDVFAGWRAVVPVAGAAIGAVTPFFSGQLATFLKITERSAGGGTVAARVLAQIALTLAALVVPALIWLVYLRLCMRGILDDHSAAAAAPPWSWGWYLAATLVLWCITAFLRPNANSLHSLYRDRLSKAFLFDPTPMPPQPGDPPGNDFAALDGFKLSTASPPAGGPYHLVNAALNIQGSKHANQRGRNADFFLFSPLWVGSESTGYVPTTTMETIDKQLDLATAMAVSGAAASSDMGAKTIRALSPTLALLNIRLGYWMRNPRRIGDHSVMTWLLRTLNFYLVVEMLGLLNERRPAVYLTDGGHIENLGLYQLLKRGCRFIVVVDAEADREYGFASLIALQRYARIDLGVRIDLPWQGIAVASLQMNQSSAGPMPVTGEGGPHCALGLIHYPNHTDGILLYVKSSLTGDENDYILDYKRRNPDFPHETTGDQFFSEEQFEVYRALGYHAVEGALNGEGTVAWDQQIGGPTASERLEAIRQQLG